MKKMILLLIAIVLTLSMFIVASASLPGGTEICAEDNESSLQASAMPAQGGVGNYSKGDTSNIRVTLTAGEYNITKDESGLDVIQMAGFSSTDSPGDPMLPHKVYNIIVPPDVIGSSLQLKVVSAEISIIEGTYDIKPAGPALAGPDGGMTEDWGEGKVIVNGRNTKVYETNANYPENYLELLPYSQMRKWKFARVDFTPFQYNPMSKKLTLIESVVLELRYNQSPAELNERLMEDTSMDDTAAQISLNYEEAKGWYEYSTVTPKEGNGGSVSITLNAGQYDITKDESGLDVIQMAGFSSTDSPGDPMLVHKVYDVLVPPDAIGSSLQLEIVSAEISIIEGTYDIKPAGPAIVGAGGELTEDWGEGKVIVNGRNIKVYGTNANYPENYLELLPYSQMRKWRFAKVDFIPFQYNPVSKKLTLIESVVLKISYTQSPAKLDENLMADTVMDDIAPQIFLNYDEASDWYEQKLGIVPRQATYDYVIITTNLIETHSAKLSSFITHKQSLGHTVLVMTEDDFGGLTGQAPNHKAEKIRQWLKNNYVSMGIKYVLLIGDPHPYESGEGDIPMKMCWPRYAESIYRESPTDYFYADLTGNWDINGDLIYGQWGVDYPVSGGVDFSPEVYVGRIPVYSAAYTTLDNILQKIINYETAGSVSWRKSIMMPMGFQSPTGPYDGAPLGEQMRDDYLNANSYASWRMYQQGNGACGLDSIYTSEQELRGGTVVKNRWTANDYGIVCWWGHGSSAHTSVGYDGCWDGTLFQSSYCSSLDDSHPAFTYQCSCTNGYPENSDNLQYAILKRGGIGTVSATRVSWFLPSVGYGDFDGSTTNSGIGYEYVKRLVQELPGGDALYQTKQSMSPSANWWLMNWYDFNLYGDPEVPLKKTEAQDDYGVFRNGRWYIDTTGNQKTNLAFWYGTTGDIPVVGDFSSCYPTPGTAPQSGVRVPAIAPGAEEVVSSTQVSEEHCASGPTLTYEVPSVPLGEYEIKYDDGTAENGWTFTDSGVEKGGIYAVCFTPPEYPVTVKKARLFIDDYGTPSTPIKIHVFQQATGSSAPGTELITPITVTPPGPGWYDVDLSGYNIVINSGSFAIGEEPTQSESVYLGEDQSGTIDKRSWWYSGSSHAWRNWVDDMGKTGDLMIRAIVETGGAGELDDYGVFRNGRWYIDTTGNHKTNLCFWYGTTGDKPVVGDVG